MPGRGSVMSATEVQLAREACAPILASITDRLLRSGLAGFVQFRQQYVAECRRAMSASSGSKSATTQQPQQQRRPPPPSSSSRSILSARSLTATATAAAASSGKAAEAQPRVARRLNPEGLRGVFAHAGVLVAPAEFRAVVVAYSDAVGFIIADDFLADLHPCRGAALNLVRTCTAAVAETLFAEVPLTADQDPAAAAGGVSDGGGDAARGASSGDSDFAAVAVESVHDVLLQAVFDARDAGTGCETALASVAAAVDATFTADVYPDGAVPAEDVVAIVVLALQQHPSITSTVLERLRAAPPLQVAAASSSSLSAGGVAGGRYANTSTRGGLDGTALFTIRHTGDTTQRKFEYYGDNVDRRDEWIRGRQESDARPAYQRHTVGYGGHLPEYQYRFGRTFHVIEEDLPQLTKPKAAPEPVPANWYGDGVELKDSRMNAHHYRLA